MTELQKEIKPYLKENDSNINIIFKSGFLACIKAVEDTNNMELGKLLRLQLIEI